MTALDFWSAHTWQDGRPTIEFLSRATGVHFNIVEVDLDAPDLDLSGLGRFDVVLLLGVFYHLFNPIGALQQIGRLVNEVLVVETHIEHFLEDSPAMLFYPGAELDEDPTNWWGPNRACMIELLQKVGFSRVENTPGTNCYREVFHAYRS